MNINDLQLHDIVKIKRVPDINCHDFVQDQIIFVNTQEILDKIKLHNQSCITYEVLKPQTDFKNVKVGDQIYVIDVDDCPDIQQFNKKTLTVVWLTALYVGFVDNIIGYLKDCFKKFVIVNHAVEKPLQTPEVKNEKYEEVQNAKLTRKLKKYYKKGFVEINVDSLNKLKELIE